MSTTLFLWRYFWSSCVRTKTEDSFFHLCCSTMYLLFPRDMPDPKYAGFFKGPTSWSLEDCIMSSEWAMPARKEVWGLIISGTTPVLASVPAWLAVLVERVCSCTALGFFNMLSLYITSVILDIKKYFFLWWKNHSNILIHTVETLIGSGSLFLKIILS